jgi:hypothetical protein
MFLGMILMIELLKRFLILLPSLSISKINTINVIAGIIFTILNIPILTQGYSLGDSQFVHFTQNFTKY